MADVTPEKKLSDMLAKHLDTLSMNHIHTVHCFMNKGTALHMQLFEMLMTFLNRYAIMFTDGEVEPGDKLYRMCEMSYCMVSSLDDGPRGRHSA